MFSRISIIFYLLIFCTSGFAFAQAVPADSTTVPGVYKKLADFSKKRKVTSLIGGLILRPISTDSPKPAVAPGYQAEKSQTRYEGKIIRHINLVTFDPIGYSVSDTTKKPHGFIEKSGNAFHVKTQHLTIRNQLLIHQNDRFDSLLVKESERLIRSQSYIQNVEVTAALTSENSDSVDIFIRTTDLWSIIPNGAISNTRATFELADRNLAGFGHTFSNSFTQNYVNGNTAFSTYYFIPNIHNTYISTRLAYAVDENRNYYKSLNIERQFFSPLTRWAGGIYVSQQKKPAWIYKNDTTRLLLNSKYTIQDYWAAAAWQVFNGNSESDRTTKLILSGRVFNIKYLEKPIEPSDLLEYYTDERFFMSGIGISSRRYLRQNYIFRFGTPEDVPLGYAFELVGGYQIKNSERWYLGVQHSWGNMFKWGYLGSKFEYGTFFNSTRASEGVLTASINYFSELYSAGRWKIRQFIKPELAIGINQASYSRLSLNDGYGLNGFNSNVLSGTSRFLLVLQTQSYAPWNLLGFRFGPYMNLSFGMLGDENLEFGHSKMYPQIGFGILIRNDYLMISNIQLSFAFYPSIPGNGDNVFKANPFRTTDFGFPDFIVGKPEIIQFH